jgi:energy-coupling factor transporter ATP-binding protein EcfA2
MRVVILMLTPELIIESNGAVIFKDINGSTVCDAEHWTGVFHTNQINIKVAIVSDLGQQPILVLPRKVENVFSLLSDSVYEELELSFNLRGLIADSEKITSLIKQLDLENLLCLKPEDLSGGQKTRLALAVLLLRNPRILVMDNSLGALDHEYMNLVADVLRSYTDTEGLRVIELTTCKLIAVEMLDSCYFQNNKVFECVEKNSISHKYELWLSHYSEKYALTRTATRKNADHVLHAEEIKFDYSSGFSIYCPKLRVNVGEILWLIGSNGSGKTTFLKCIAMLLRPKGGILQFRHKNETVQVDFTVLRKVNDKDIHRIVLYQFQEPDDQIYCESVKEELLATAKNGSGNIEHSLKTYCQIFGFSAYLSESPWDLHRSDRRLLTLASVLIANPDIALLDEPTVELDWEQKQKLAIALSEYVKCGGTAIVISHDSDFMESISSSKIYIQHGNVK